MSINMNKPFPIPPNSFDAVLNLRVPHLVGAGNNNRLERDSKRMFLYYKSLLTLKKEGILILGVRDYPGSLVETLEENETYIRGKEFSMGPTRLYFEGQDALTTEVQSLRNWMLSEGLCLKILDHSEDTSLKQFLRKFSELSIYNIGDSKMSINAPLLSMAIRKIS